MAVEVRVPGPLQRLTNGARTLQGEGKTVRELVDYLDVRYPGFKERVIGPDGTLRSFINVYVNEEEIRFLQGLETPLEDDDVVSLLPAVAGGEVGQ